MAMRRTPLTFNLTLWELRNAAGFGQAEMARAVGIPVSAWCNAERGALPQARSMRLICNYFDKSPVELFNPLERRARRG